MKKYEYFNNPLKMGNKVEITAFKYNCFSLNAKNINFAADSSVRTHNLFNQTTNKILLYLFMAFFLILSLQTPSFAGFDDYNEWTTASSTVYPWQRVAVYFTVGWMDTYANIDTSFLLYTYNGEADWSCTPSYTGMLSDAGDDDAGSTEAQAWRLKTHIPAPGRNIATNDFRYIYKAKDVWNNYDQRASVYWITNYDSDQYNVQWDAKGANHNADVLVDGQSYCYRTLEGSNDYADSCFDNETIVLRVRAFKEDITTITFRSTVNSWADGTMSYASIDYDSNADFNNAYTVEFWYVYVTPAMIANVIADTSYVYYNFAYADLTDTDYLKAVNNTGGADGSAMQDAAAGGNEFYFRIYDDDTSAPDINDTLVSSPESDSYLVISLNLTDSNGVSASRSHAYFAWTSAVGPNTNFYDTYGVNITGDTFNFSCPYNIAGNTFTDSAYSYVYWKVVYADSDNDGNQGDADSTTAATGDSVMIVPDTPLVITGAASSILTETAVLNASIKFFYTPSAQVYFNYRLEGSSDWTDTTVPETKNKSGNCDFTVYSFDTPVYGLTEDTNYEFRAAASYGSDSVVYGETSAFSTLASTMPTVITLPATDTMLTQAVLNCNFTVGGFDTVYVYFEYKKISDTEWISTTGDTYDTDGSHSDTPSLSSGTVYHFRALIQYDNGDTYTDNNITVFNTVYETPAVTTEANFDPQDVSCIIKGSLSLNDFDSAYTYFEYQLVYDGSSNWDTTPPEYKTSDGIFTYQLTGLISDTYYEYRAVVLYGSGDTNYGDSIIFQTDELAPSCTTLYAVNVDTNSAVLYLEYSIGTYSSLTSYIQYKPEGSAHWFSTAEENKSSNGTDSYTLTNLIVWCPYEFRAAVDYGINSTRYGDTLIFKTKKSDTVEMNIRGTFDDPSFPWNDTTEFYTINCPPNTARNIIQVSPGDRFKILNTNAWSTDDKQWSDSYFINDYDTKVWWIPSNDIDKNDDATFMNGSMTSISPDKYLIVTAKYPMNNGNWQCFGFMLTRNPPVEIISNSRYENSVELYGGDTMSASSPIWVYITLSHYPSDENIFIRYSYDSWNSSYVSQATGSGTSYVGTIPPLGSEVTVEYYTLVSTADLANATTNPDTLFISIFNNNGNNDTIVLEIPVPSPDTSVVAFSPNVDGVKDSLWGDSPSAESLSAAQPYNVQGDNTMWYPAEGGARDIYITNDIKYLYVGFEASGCYFEGDADQSTHYGLLFFTSFKTSGPNYDPWVSTTTTSTYNPDIWINGWIGYDAEDFGAVLRYVASGGVWTDTTEIGDNDAALSAKTHFWGEIRVPLSLVNVNVGDSLAVILTHRHQSDKAGLSDLTPFQAGAVSNWGDNSATVSADLAEYYILQNHMISASHYPETEPVAGKGTMRNPVTPNSNQSVSISVKIEPVSLTSNVYLYYDTTGNWVNADSMVMPLDYTSGGAEYHKVTMPVFEKNTVCTYYIKIDEYIDNFIYGDTYNSYIDTSETLAQTNAFVYYVQNGAPSVPSSLSLTPITPSVNDDILAEASGSSDVDNDQITYKFEWYKNDVHQSSLDTYDNSSPYTSTLSSSETSLGDKWYCYVSAGDGFETSTALKSNSVKLAEYLDWSGSAPSEINTALIADSEWIWTDKTADQRNIPPSSLSFDITECRLKLDDTYLYFRFNITAMANDNYPNIAVTFDTDGKVSSGNNIVGDESQTSVGDSYSGYAPLWEQMMILHTYKNHIPLIEVTNGASYTEYSDITFDSDVSVVEGRIPRTAVGLIGTDSVTIQIAVFKNRLGKSSAINSTVEYPSCDILDAVSIPGCYGTVTSYNDNNLTLTAYEEEADDADMDFWFVLNYDSTKILSDNKPTAPSNPQPVNAGETTNITPTFSWDPSSDIDSGDTVTSYLFELGTDSEFDNNVSYRLNLKGSQSYITLPGNLTAQTLYYWRVRARDKTGTLSDSTVWSFTTTGAPEISVNSPRDINNTNNLNNNQGLESKYGYVNWFWPPAVHSAGGTIQFYAIQISEDSTFASYDIYDTIIGDQINGCTTNYSISTDSAYLLTRGKTYYARISATDTAGNSSGWSSISDGIFYSLKNIDGSAVNDWKANPGWSNDTYYYIGDTYYEGVWNDSTITDIRNDGYKEAPYLDMDEFHVASDKYNLYFYIKFVDFSDTLPYIQIALDVNDNSTERFFWGGNGYDQDAAVSSEVPWEYLIRIITSTDKIYIHDNAWFELGVAKYVEGSDGIEVCIPFDFIGGSALYKSSSINITMAIFWDTGGTIGNWNNDNNACNIVESITEESLWNEVDDKVVDYYLVVDFDSSYRVSDISSVDVDYTPMPGNPSPGNTDYNWNFRRFVIYNIFPDRYWSGRSDNQPTGQYADPNVRGGDFQGLIDVAQTDYFNWLGMNAIKTGPTIDYGSNSGWGYSPSNYYKTNWSFCNPSTYSQFGGRDEYVNFIKELHHRNIEYGPDYIVPHAGSAASLNPEFYYKADGSVEPRFGIGILEWVAEARQYHVDYVKFLYGLGVSFLRCDNPKMWGDNGGQIPQAQCFWAYWRHGIKTFAPDLYVFGELPGDISPFVWDQERLHGALSMSGFGGRVKDWAGQNQYNWTASDLRSQFYNNYDNDYGYSSVMINYYENHDHDRAYHSMGDNMNWNASIGAMQTLMMWLAGGVGDPYVFYGDELVMMGKVELTYPDWLPNWDPKDQGLSGNTRRMPWDWTASTVGYLDHSNNWFYGNYDHYLALDGHSSFQGSVSDIIGMFPKAFSARQIFTALKYDQSDIQWKYVPTDNGAVGFVRGIGTGEEMVVLINPNNAPYEFTNVDVGSNSATYEDWFTGGEVTANSNYQIPAFTVGANYAAFLKINGFGKGNVDLTVEVSGQPVKGAIVSVDDKACWTRSTDNNGYVKIWDIVVTSGSYSTYSLKIWYPGYKIYDVNWNFYDNQTVGGITIDLATDTNAGPDNDAPATPLGLMGKARDRSVELDWADNSESDFESYYLYRSTTPNDANPTLIMECLRSIYFDRNLDDKLSNGTTYYYKVKARDRNDNLSSFSNEIAVTPNKTNVILQVDVSGIEASEGKSANKVYIKGNSIALGRFGFTPNGEWEGDALESPIAMTNKGRGIWEYTCQIDPDVHVVYNYWIDWGSGGWWEDWPSAGGTYWTTYSYEDGRTFTVTAANGDSQAVVRVFNTDDNDRAPQSPSGLTAIGKNQLVQLGWTLNLEADIDHYAIQRADDVGFTTNVVWANVDKNIINYTDYNVTNDSTYYYRIYAMDKKDNASSASNYVTVTPSTAQDIDAPDSPANLRATEAGTGRAKIYWDYNTEGDLAGYNLYRSTSPSFTLSSDNKVNTTIISVSYNPYFIDSNLSPGILYYYAATALDDVFNESDSSALFTLKLSRVTFNVDVGDVSPSSVQIISNNRDIIGLDPGVNMTLVEGTNSTYETTQDLIVGNDLHYKYAYNYLQVQEADFSTGTGYREIIVTDVAENSYNDDWEEIPVTVSDVAAEPDSGSALISWTANTSNEDIAGYNVYRQVGINFVKQNTSIITNTYYTVTGLDNGTTYYFTVRSIDSGDMQFESDNSSVVSVTPAGTVSVIFQN